MEEGGENQTGQAGFACFSAILGRLPLELLLTNTDQSSVSCLRFSSMSIGAVTEFVRHRRPYANLGRSCYLALSSR
jgi:hypothetical protein